MSVRDRSCVALLVIATLMPVGVSAQVIRGRTVDSITHAPISGALAELRDADGKVLQQAFTGPRGEFGFLAPVGPHYQVRIAAIGFAARGALDVPPSNDPVTLPDIVLTPVAVSLPELTAMAGKRACGKSELTPDVFGGLFESAHTSLQLMDATLKSQDIAFETRTVHTISVTRPRDSVLRADTTDRMLNAWPIRSLSVDSLQLVGFQRPMTPEEGTGRIWYGPDLGVLFSDWFLDTHCFTLDKKQTRGDTVYIRFDPAGHHTDHAELSGDLVIDRATLTLRRLTYALRNIPDGVSDGAAGGDMEFTELSPGLWVPTAWSIWAPVTKTFRTIGRPVLTTTGGRGGIRLVEVGPAESYPPIVQVVGRDEVHGRVVRVVPR